MKKLYMIMAAAGMPLALIAQNPIDAYQLSQPELRGTARFMSMAGAFGALGGDLSTLSQNPGGIGVYRSSEVGLTFNIDCQSSNTDYQGFKMSDSQTKFYLNNIGIVGTLRLNNSAVPNLNLGFTYNKGASFSRRYKGGIPQLKTSLSNYIAGIANNYHLNEGDVRTTNNYDPYNPGYGQRFVPWSAILGYDSYLINPEGNPEDPIWQGQFGNGTTGSGQYNVVESGSLDEYNIVVGGNFANKVFWGMNFDIVSVDYSISSVWGENLKDAYVYDPNVGSVGRMDANWALSNLYNVSGTGFNYQLGVIVKPIQELRIGLAFHTPTWYHLTEHFYAENVDYSYPFQKDPQDPANSVPGNDYATTNNGDPSYNNINLTSPWKVIASIAGVFGSKCIVSFDYEWNGFKNMEYHTPTYNSFDYDYDYGYGYDDWWWKPTRADDFFNPTPAQEANQMIKKIYRNSSTIRIGAEYRILNNLSVRAGYSHVWSPVTVEAKNNMANIPTNGTLANFRLDNDTNYITAGIGYRVGGFYIDAAYVWKHMTSSYYPFSADPLDVANTSMSPNITFNNSQIVLSAGYKF